MGAAEMFFRKSKANRGPASSQYELAPTKLALEGGDREKVSADVPVSKGDVCSTGIGEGDHPHVRAIEILPTESGAWVRFEGGQAIEMDARGLILKGSIRSRQIVEPIPGATYRLEARVRAVRDSTNGEPLNFCCGPIAIDSIGRMLVWWRGHEPIRVNDGARIITVDVTVPEGAAIVCAGFSGPYPIREGGEEGNGVLVLEAARLFELNDVSSS